MGTAGISLTCCTMSPKSLIFLDLTERKLIVQTVICHFEDYPGSPATLKVLNVLLALAICGRFCSGTRTEVLFGGTVGRFIGLCREWAPGASAGPARAAFRWQQSSSAVTVPGWASWPGGRGLYMTSVTRWEIKQKQWLLNHNLVFNLTVSLCFLKGNSYC